MENASKALLIAGAILIAILLIGIGMMVFNGIDGITGQAGQQIDAMSIQMFNKQFEQYVGKNVSGANVRALYNAVSASNATYADDTSMQVTITVDGTAPQSASSIGANYRYEVSVTKNNSGYINAIAVTSKK